MALTGTRLNEPFTWSPEAEMKLKPADRSVFTFVLPSAGIRAMIFDGVLVMQQDDQGRLNQVMRNGHRNIELMRFCLRNVTHFHDPDKKPIEYERVSRFVDGVEYENASDAYISRLPLAIINEAANMLVEKISLEGGLAKK
jgi:hypothetical protein